MNPLRVGWLGFAVMTPHVATPLDFRHRCFDLSMNATASVRIPNKDGEPQQTCKHAVMPYEVAFDATTPVGRRKVLVPTGITLTKVSEPKKAVPPQSTVQVPVDLTSECSEAFDFEKQVSTLYGTDRCRDEGFKPAPKIVLDRRLV